MKDSDAYKTYYDFATGKVILKPKYVRRSTKEKTDQAPKASPGKRLKATAKVAKSGKKKLHAQGLEILSEIAFDEDDDDEVSMSKDDDDNVDNEDDDGKDDDNEQIELDNDDLRVHTPSHFETTNDKAYDDVTQGDDVEEEMLDEKEINEEKEVNELYRDANVNLERRDTEMTDALLTNVQGFISNILNPNPDTDRVKALEDNFLEFKQTNLFVEAVSSIPGIVDKYLANQMNEAIKEAVQLQSDRLRSKAQVDNDDLIIKIDENMKKIIKEQVKTSHVIAANLSELELKKILIDKMENNKSIDKSVQQKNLYKALDEDEGPSVGSNRGSKRRRARKEPESTSSPKEKTSKSTGQSKEWSQSHQAEEPTHNVKDVEKPAHHEFDTGFTKDQPVDDTTQLLDCTLARNEHPHESFDELIDTPLDFSAFVLNWLKVDTLTLELLSGPTFELMKGLCKSLVELEYFLKEVCKATTDQLD
ncbi:hypothetical protein Tco_1373888 [Tanacetum coccineum]